MAATGRDGGRGLSVPWRYRLREQTGRSNSYDNSISSSSSGTTVSTAYTSSGSRLSSISMDAVRHFELALEADWLVEDKLVRPTKKSCIEREEGMKHMYINLVQEFFCAPSAEVVLERWFAELDIAWVLHLPDADGDDASAELHHTSADAAKSWIRGLHRILEAIRSTPTVFSGLPKVCDSEDQPVPESDKQDNNVPDQIHFARFTKEAMSKMLPFVDFAIRQVVVCTPYKKQLGHLARSWIAALNVIQVCLYTYLDGSCNKEEGTFSPAASEFARFLQSSVSKMLPFVDAVAAPNVGPPRIQDTLSNSSNGEAMTEPTTEEKLQALIGVRDALSAASEKIQLWPHCPPFLGSRDIIDEMSNLLSAKLDKLDQAILDTVDEIRTSITSLLLDSHEADSMDSEAVQGSPNIHKVTRFIVNCIKVLSTNYTLVHQIVSKAARLGKYVPEYGKASPLTMNTDDPFAALITEMISCLQEKLLRVSQPFPDQGLQFLFLLNNTYFMWQQLHPSSALEPYMSVLTCKIDDHIQSYLQVSWAPVLSCLHDPTPLCLGRYSPLAKFQLEFQKTSNAQKLWKVPDPELRGRLRKAIIEKVSSGFTKYLEDYNVNSPRVTSQVLEETLQELFEG